MAIYSIERTPALSIISKIRKTFKQLYFHVIKLPLIYVAISIGFIFEYLITFPYIVLCTLDSVSKKNSVSQKDIVSQKDNPFNPEPIKKKPP